LGISKQNEHSTWNVTTRTWKLNEQSLSHTKKKNNKESGVNSTRIS
jgi:hypothetical protein